MLTRVDLTRLDYTWTGLVDLKKCDWVTDKRYLLGRLSPTRRIKNFLFLNLKCYASKSLETLILIKNHILLKKIKYQNVRVSVKNWIFYGLLWDWVINKNFRDSLSWTPCVYGIFYCDWFRMWYQFKQYQTESYSVQIYNCRFYKCKIKMTLC